MNSVTIVKRKELRAFIEQVLEPEEAVQAVIGIGSIATGLMGPDSDIDAVVFFDPMAWYIIPAEFLWRPSDGTFHSIFSNDEAVTAEAIQLDCLRLDLSVWREEAYEWPEGRKAELAAGWVAYDRTGEVADLVSKRTAFPDSIRQERLDEAIIWMDQHLGWGDLSTRWERLGAAIAHDRLQAAYEWLVQALFTYNRRWLPWRNRQMESLLDLPWLPQDFDRRVLAASNAPDLDLNGYLTRAAELKSLFDEFLTKVVADGLYSTSPIDQAFIRAHDGPGYAWDMEEWSAENLVGRLAQIEKDRDVAEPFQMETEL